jgi:cation diffusion facilitator CzcD-associated flavoprotein CzcO
MSANYDTVIVGAGFSGMGMAIRLKQQGRDDFVVLERADEVGGTWWYNTYPGCACDVPSHLYSYSYAPNPEWSETYSRQPEIRDYLSRCADRFGLRPHLRLGTEATGAEWDEDERVWRVETSAGTVTGRILIAGMGPLHAPKVPRLPGLERFEGTTFHSAQWNHDYDLTGKRVASIGTGASAIQYVPEIQPQVERLHVFQRTAPWVMPHSTRPITAVERRLYKRFPVLQRLMRGAIYGARELLVLGFAKRPRLMGLLEKLARKHMESQISDPELRAKVTPDYTIGCKRILPSNHWYRTLAQDNVELVTDGIREVRANSIVGEDGVEREVDAIIFGTGFHVTDMPVAQQVRGRDGKLLDDHWHGSPQAHLGCTVPGFPNFFLLLGPNTGLGHSSMVYMIESQVAYVLDALRVMDERRAETFEVSAEVAERFNAELQEELGGTVWNTGCSSWYLDDTGRNATLWPDWTFRFRQRTARFEPAHHRLEAPRPERAPAAAA